MSPLVEQERRWWLGLVLLVLFIALAAVLRFSFVDTLSFRIDEISAVETGKARFFEVFHQTRPDKAPLYYLVEHFFLQLEEGEFWARFPAVVFSLLSIPLFFLLARGLLSFYASLLATFLFSLSPFLLYYSIDNGPYTLFLLLGLANLWLFRVLMERQRDEVWLWGCFYFLNVLLVYSHYLGLMLLGCEWLYLLVYLARQRRGGSKFLLFTLNVLFVGVALLPLGYRLYGLKEWEVAYRFPGDWLGFVDRLFADFTYGYGYWEAFHWPQSWLYWLPFTIAGLLARWREREKLIFIVWLLATQLVFLLLFFRASDHWLEMRYFFACWPLYLLLVARGWVALVESVSVNLAQLLRQPHQAKSLKLYLWTLSLSLVALSLGAFYLRHPPERDQWREVAHYIRKHYGAGHQIVAANDTTHFAFGYYHGRLGLPQRLIHCQSDVERLTRYLTEGDEKTLFVDDALGLRHYYTALLPRREFLGLIFAVKEPLLLMDYYVRLRSKAGNVDFGDAELLWLGGGWGIDEIWYGDFHFRWMTAQLADLFVVWYPPFPRQLRLKAKSFTYTGGEEKEVLIYINDQFAGEFSAPCDWELVDVELEQGGFRPGINKVSLYVEQLEVPGEVLQESRDARTLGVAVSRVKLEF